MDGGRSRFVMGRQFAVLIVAVRLLLTAPAASGARVEGDSTLIEQYSFGAFRNATRLGIDRENRVFVVDADANTVSCFSLPGNLLGSMGGYGWGDGSFDVPTGVAFDGLNVWIADHGNHRIERFDRRLTFLSSLSTRDTSVEEARFGYPLGIAVSAMGDLFVLDGENLRVVKFTSSQVFDRSFPGTNVRSGKFERPLKIVVTDQENVYVAESDRILQFDYFGNYVQTIGVGFLSGLRGFCADRNGIIAVTGDALQFLTTGGALAKTIPWGSIVTEKPVDQPQDVIVGESGLLLLDRSCVRVFTFH